MTPNEIQPREYSKGSATDGALHMNDGSVVGDNVAYVYANDNGRNLNRNMLDNRWNRACRFLRVRQSQWLPTSPSTLGEVGVAISAHPCGNTGVLILFKRTLVRFTVYRATRLKSLGTNGKDIDFWFVLLGLDRY